MKKWKLAAGICMVLCVLSLLIIWQIAIRQQSFGSGGVTDIAGNETVSEAATETQTQTETKETDERLPVIEDLPKELQSQLLCILENKDIWIKGAGQPLDKEQHEVVQTDIWYYMISDLDRNGQLEIVCSLIGEEGLRSTSFFYEVNKEATGLIPITYDDALAGESEPDIIENGTESYYDPQEQVYYYIEEDVVRAGISDSYIVKSAISLREGNVHNRILMYAKDAPNYMGTYTIYTDSYGNRIGESKYSDADRYFEECEKKKASFEWFVIEYELIDNQSEAAVEDVTEEDIRLLEQLKASYEGFSISE